MGKDFWVAGCRNMELNFTDDLGTQYYREGTQSIGAFRLNPDTSAGALITHYFPKGKTAISQKGNWLQLKCSCPARSTVPTPKKETFNKPSPVIQYLIQETVPHVFLSQYNSFIQAKFQISSARYLPEWINDSIKSHQGYYILQITYHNFSQKHEGK